MYQKGKRHEELITEQNCIMDYEMYKEEETNV